MSNSTLMFESGARLRTPREPLMSRSWQADWWLEEHGLIMERPEALPPGLAAGPSHGS